MTEWKNGNAAIIMGKVATNNGELQGWNLGNAAIANGIAATNNESCGGGKGKCSNSYLEMQQG